MSLVDEYTEAVGLDHRKHFAQFFTPPPIARFMVEWALAGSSRASVHDPAFGLGSFLENAPQGCEFSGTDIDGAILDFYRARRGARAARLSQADYLLDFGGRYDNIVCNPPYLRFQKFLNRDEVFRAFRERLGARLSGYTNIASAFLIKSICELNDGGRLAYIMPSEFMNAGYGTMVKDWLVRDGHLDSVIEVECEREAFGEVTTSVCIVLYDKARNFDAVSFRRVSFLSELADVMARQPVSRVPLCSLDAKGKWGRFFVPADNRVQIAQGLLQPLSEYGHFSRGIATGANQFFVLSRSDIAREALPEADCRPCITRSQQLKGLVFTDDDFARLSAADASVYLFSPGDPPCEESLRYIRRGEARGCDSGYITRHRKPWYKMETRKVSPLLLNVFSRAGYKVVRNYSSALSLTNFHCFYPHPMCAKYVDWLFLYLQSGVGRKILSLSKRKYGNLLDKFEPNDLNSAMVPSREFFDSLDATLPASIIESVCAGKKVDVQLDAMFASLLSENGAKGSGCVLTPMRYPKHKPEQMRLAIEKRKGYKGAEKGGKKTAAKAEKPKAGDKTKPKARASVKARYAKHG